MFPNRQFSIALRVVLGTAAACMGFSATGSVAADPLGSGTAELRYGGSLTGSIADYTSGKSRGKLIRLDPGLLLALPDVEIRQLETDEEKLAEYQRLVAAAPETAEAHWELSRWCNAQRMYAQKERHLRHVLELDPNHGPARQELDYEPTEDGWAKRTAVRRERGMIRDGGAWRFAEEVSVLRNEKETELARKGWIRTLAGLRTQILRRGPRGAEAMSQLLGISDPHADAAVARELLSGKSDGPIRREVWIEILGRLKTPTAVDALIKTSMNDPSASIRDLCFERLKEHGKYQAITYYVSQLRDSDNRVVNSAGRALIELNHPEIALDLVDAIKTKHRRVIAPGNDTNVSMSPTGGGGMQFGGKAQVIEKEVANPSVLEALRQLVPEGVNYQYDQDAWRQYFARLLAPRPGDLRRDP